jgi:hypothetical protein
MIMQPSMLSMNGNGEQPPEEGVHKVRVHSPDKKQYHNQGHATMIPRSQPGDGGQSLGCNFKKTGAINVEPSRLSDGSGGITLDYTNVDEATTRAIYAKAAEMEDDPQNRTLRAHQLMQMHLAGQSIVTVATQAEPAAPTVNPHMPGTYVAPGSNLNGAQMTVPAIAPVGAAHPQNPGQQQPVAAQPMPVQHMQPVQQQPDPWSAIHAMQGQFNQMMGMMQAMQQTAPAPMPLAPVQAPVPHAATVPELPGSIMDNSTSPNQPMAAVPELVAAAPVAAATAPAVQQPVKQADATYTADAVAEVIGKAFGSLKVPSLGFESHKPKHRVLFDLGAAGMQAAWFHWVTVEDNGVFLIYDTRFQYGNEYYPPNTGTETPITVDLPDQNLRYSCYSAGFTHNFGVFRVVCLFRVDEQTEQLPSPEEVGPEYDNPMQSGTTIESLLQNGGTV